MKKLKLKGKKEKIKEHCHTGSCRGGGVVYGLGFIGAAAYYIIWISYRRE